MEPVHIATLREVKPGKEAEFKQAILRFIKESLDMPGTMGAFLVEPPPDSKRRMFGILRSFDDASAAEAFYASERFAEWEKEIAPLVIGSPTRQKLSGLEAFFRGYGRQPPRWKMAVVTWLGVFPTAVVFTWLVAPRLAFLPSLGITAVINVCIVAALTWVVMPVLTKVLSRWLHSGM